MPKHRNVAIFVPHQGCPHRCVFCDQRAISGQSEPPTPDDVRRAAEIALADGETGGEIAFFGGSFTAVHREYMISLLEAAYPYIKRGAFSGVRCSTRPDAIDRERLDILRAYGVDAVELGAQSADDRILRLNDRGHTFAQTERACALIREYGIGLGLQMMTGMYGETEGSAIYTAERFRDLRPDTMRIYPTVVLKGTRLASLYEGGEYTPQTVEEATELCARLLMIFYEAGIPVIRLGLHSGGAVDESFAAGPYHPAFRELCEGKIYLSLMLDGLSGLPGGEYTVFVAPSEISKAVGQKRANLTALAERGWRCSVRGGEETAPYKIEIVPAQ